MAYVRSATERGRAQFGWLDSNHSFSFGSYYDPNHMGVSVLRVINDDRVDPGAGFGAHGHRDMEILSYVLEGEIEHRDSMGNIKRIPAGDFQIMSAGTGVMHSEYNASATEGLHFLQIWLMPNTLQVAPRYEQQAFPRTPGGKAILHPEEAGAMRVYSDARLWRYTGGRDWTLALHGKQVYVHGVSGQVTVAGHSLGPGDGMALEASSVTLTGDANTEALVFDLP
ncbi:pirin family protein [Saccharospirillum impatiens]|uniref:pirin family protein n=1 Tax=Saccharospirillum impatiens TaxID=169438 RepID=UPI00040769A4|nr:pirin-like bicupin family protein [Saccharospirillum impatiens]